VDFFLSVSPKEEKTHGSLLQERKKKMTPGKEQERANRSARKKVGNIKGWC